MSGKRGLIMGLANAKGRSLGYRQETRRAGAELAFPIRAMRPKACRGARRELGGLHLRLRKSRHGGARRRFRNAQAAGTGLDSWPAIAFRTRTSARQNVDTSLDNS